MVATAMTIILKKFTDPKLTNSNRFATSPAISIEIANDKHQGDRSWPAIFSRIHKLAHFLGQSGRRTERVIGKPDHEMIAATARRTALFLFCDRFGNLVGRRIRNRLLRISRADWLGFEAQKLRIHAQQ